MTLEPWGTIFYILFFHVCVLSHVQLFETSCSGGAGSPPALLSVGFSRQENWSNLSFPAPRDPPDLGIKSSPLESPALAGRFFTIAPPGKHFILTWWLFILELWNSSTEPSLKQRRLSPGLSNSRCWNCRISAFMMKWRDLTALVSCFPTVRLEKVSGKCFRLHHGPMIGLQQALSKPDLGH